jgi:hypothetical protein
MIQVIDKDTGITLLEVKESKYQVPLMAGKKLTLFGNISYVIKYVFIDSRDPSILRVIVRKEKEEDNQKVQSIAQTEKR